MPAAPAARRCSSPCLAQQLLDLAHDLRDPLLFLQDVLGQLLRRQVLEVLLTMRVFDVQIAAVRQHVGGSYFPGAVVLLSIFPPSHAVGKLLELDGLSFGVVLPAFGQRVLIIPDVFRQPGAIKEQQVSWNACIGRKDTVGKPDDGMKVELLEQFLLDAGADTVAKKGAIGCDNSSSTGLGLSSKFPHDELKKEKRCFRGLLVFGKVREDTALFFTAEWWIGKDDVYAVLVADFLEWKTQRIARVNLGGLQTVQEQVHLRQQVWKRLGFATEQASSLL